MAEVFFFIAGTGAVAGAIGVIALRNPFYSVLALVGHLMALAALFLLLRAQFVAAAQVVVYAGAVMVLYVFVVAYVGGSAEPVGPTAGAGLRFVSGLTALGLFVVFCIATLGSGLDAIGSEGAGFDPSPPEGQVAFGTPEHIGRLLLTKFLLAFEVASFLLLIAAVGAVVLARRRGGMQDEEQRVSVADLLRPEGTGTMAEAVSGLTGTPARELSSDEERDRLASRGGW